METEIIFRWFDLTEEGAKKKVRDLKLKDFRLAKSIEGMNRIKKSNLVMFISEAGDVRIFTCRGLVTFA